MVSWTRTLNSSYFLLPIVSVVGTHLFIWFIYLYPHQVTAQVCLDASGPLIVNQTFGISSKPLSTALTPYPYEAINCPGDGQYTIAPALDGSCFNATWNAIPSDHTPNESGGNMMIINGGNKAGAFYQQPVSGLCSGTTYEVSFWIVNILRTGTCYNPLIPDLSIDILSQTGTVIQSTALGLIEQAVNPTWKRYSAVFTVPAAVEDVLIKLVDHQGDYGCGNDMAIDDFQLKQCSDCAGVPETVYIPDAFTPNNDGMNDTLLIFLSASVVNSYNFTVFNRWGNPVYTSSDSTQRWDGSCNGLPCQAGTYTWTLTYSTANKSTQPLTGRVLLMR